MWGGLEKVGMQSPSTCPFSVLRVSSAGLWGAGVQGGHRPVRWDPQQAKVGQNLGIMCPGPSAGLFSGAGPKLIENILESGNAGRGRSPTQPQSPESGGRMPPPPAGGNNELQRGD